jgi:NADH-quinone oxidoreductase subunit F
MLFSVSGDVVRPGVYEVPLGTPLRELVEGICGGVSGGRTLKAVFPGGPSYGLLVPDEIDTPLSFESLRSAGSGLGAGSVRVCADGCCMVRVALEYARFFKEGSCGQCPPCQMGTHNLVTLLERFEAGEAYPQDFSVLEDLCRFMPGRGACGLITGAALSAGSILKRFRVEFEAHREGKSCPFGS